MSGHGITLGQFYEVHAEVSAYTRSVDIECSRTISIIGVRVIIRYHQYRPQLIYARNGEQPNLTAFHAASC